MFKSNTQSWLLQKTPLDKKFLLIYDALGSTCTWQKEFDSIKVMQQFIRRHKLTPDKNCVRFESIDNVFVPFTIIGTEKIHFTKVQGLRDWARDIVRAFPSSEFRLLELKD
jgi:hypothetical protein